SGRQGDPGESRFYISLEDDLMRLFGSERLIKTFEALGVPEGEQIEHKMLSSAIEKAQEKIEGNNFSIRKNLLEYDQVNNDQREIIYEQRRRVLDGENMRDVIIGMMEAVVSRAVDTTIGEDQDPSEFDLQTLNQVLLPLIPMQPVTEELVESEKLSRNKLKQYLKEKAAALYEAKEAEIEEAFPGEDRMRELERVVLLKVIDARWMNHIDDMEQLRQGIGLMAFAQHDPKVEYRMYGFQMFEEMTNMIQEETVRVLYHVRMQQKVEREPAAKVTGTNKDDSAGPKKPVQRKHKKIYPNDICPCGSGKKYKNCHGRPGQPPLDLD
ncbi:MAG: SEC-C domain-containing protein, partial [Lachnospiraceae bacterium]|nr:SEC-C domain-containing protein [Lachnospiraceae bacterium]